MQQTQIQNSRVTIFVTLTIAAASSLLFSYYVEYVIGAAPCYLCLWQRFIFYLLLGLSVIAVICHKLRNILYKLVICSILLSIAVSGYHYGVENMIFTPTKTCTTNTISQNFSSASEMKQSLMHVDMAPDCRSPGFRIMGISMTTMNLVWSIMLLCFCCSVDILCKRYVKDA